MNHLSEPLRHGLQLLRDVVYPVRCAGCTRFGALLCDGCRAALEAGRLVPEGRCPNCFAEWTGAMGLNCPSCLRWGLDLDGCRAAFAMNGTARALVHRLKFAGVRETATVMSPYLAPLWESRFTAAAAVPLHRRRQNRRGFNQASLLFRPLGWPAMPGCLERIVDTGQQVGRRELERWEHISGAFRYDGPPLAGQHIALVDDVVTTGATVVACAKVLRDAGARSVTAIAFARADARPPGEPRPLD